MKKLRKFNLFIYLFVIGNCSSYSLFSKEKQRLNKSNSIIQLDLASNYYTFFDTRKQFRVGLEYQFSINKNCFISSFVDLGQYDHYHFIKYYDVLDSHNFYTDRKVSVIGIHYLVGLNYFIKSSTRKPHQGIYFGLITDHSLYNKSFHIYDSKTMTNTKSNLQQFKFGTGLSGGLQIHVSSRLMIEGKTSIIVIVMNRLSDNHSSPMPSLAAQWNDSYSHFWWISQFKIGYEF